MILRTHSLTKRFGGVLALDRVSAEFRPGSITALVGPNGAGKSTLFTAIVGLITPDSGRVTLGDSDELPLTGLAPHEVARRGVGILFQDVRAFGKLTALENVAVGARLQPGERPLSLLLRPAKVAAREREVTELAWHYLEFVGLADKAGVCAGQLSYGQQKLVAIARLLAADARVLLLDEPTSGVHPERVDSLLELVQRLAEDHNRTVVMIEHSVAVVARVSDYVYRLEAGRIVGSGKPHEVLGLSYRTDRRAAAGHAGHAGSAR